MKQVNLSLETAKQMYFSENQALKAFALENYSKIELEKKEFPKTWEELERISGTYLTIEGNLIHANDFEAKIFNKNIFKTEEQAKAAIAMAQLSQLMHVYNDGWVANWADSNSKYTIEIFRECVYSSSYCETRKFLAFKTSEIRDEFLKNFKSLILEAKPLL